MSFINENIYIDQGALYVKDWNLKTANGSAADLSGLTLTGTVKKHPASANKTSLDGLISIVGDPLLGNIQLATTANTFITLEPGKYFYEIEGFIAAANTALRARLVQGVLFLDPYLNT